MEIWFLTVIVMGALLVAALNWRRRAHEAEATQRSVAHLFGSQEPDSALVSAVRNVLSEAEDVGARAAGFRSALEGASLGIALLDGSGRVVYTNPEAESLIGGEPTLAVLRARVTAFAKRVGASGEPEQFEVDLHDPERRVLRVTVEPLHAEVEGFAATAAYFEDLSAERRVIAMRIDFVANASHELKTPLGALSLLAETLADTSDEDQRVRLTRRLRSEATRMANVIDDVAQLAETQSLGTEFHLLSIARSVNDAVASVESLALDKGIRLESGGVADATVEGSRVQITSAIRNLLINAITYTAIKGDDGVVTYRTLLDGNMVCVEVEDTGIGVPARYADRVFERFFRVDRARSRESGGTGLGLSIVRNVAISHGGTVHMESEVGVGSTFGICLPTVSPSAEGPVSTE